MALLVFSLLFCAAATSELRSLLHAMVALHSVEAVEVLACPLTSLGDVVLIADLVDDVDEVITASIGLDSVNEAELVPVSRSSQSPDEILEPLHVEDVYEVSQGLPL